MTDTRHSEPALAVRKYIGAVIKYIFSLTRHGDNGVGQERLKRLPAANKETFRILSLYQPSEKVYSISGN